jgi:UDP-3-O-acyl-N-acetylglucosamine deacetylase
MVEHVLATLAGLRIDNCEIRVDNPEMPGCDGSSLPFVSALQNVVVPQSAIRQSVRVPKPIRVGDERVWAEARPPVGNSFVVESHIDYGTRGPIGRQSLLLSVNPDSFQQELAPARTFLLDSEADWLRSQGLGARVTCRDLLVFDQEGPIDNSLRFADECVRHKALDMVGDLALAGCDLVGHFIAHCSGHRLNAQLVTAVLEAVEAQKELRKSA